MLPCEDITTFHQKRCGSLLHQQDLKVKNNNINVQVLVGRKDPCTAHIKALSLSQPFPAKGFGCKH